MSEQEQSETSITERINKILKQLIPEQLRFVVAMTECRTKKEAAEKIGIKPASAYCWDNKDLVDEAIRLITVEPLESARGIRRKNLVKAMMIKAAGLDSCDEKVRQDTATEIIEWELGKAKQSVDVNSNLKVINVKLVRDEEG